MTTPAFQALLEAAYQAHIRVPALKGFCVFLDDLRISTYEQRWIPPSDLMVGDANLLDGGSDPLAQAFIDAAPDAQWRLTYEGTNIGQDFLDRFGCYCLIGKGGPWISDQFAAFVVYMPPHLYYTWHHHPAEEIYYILAGEAEFFREAERAEILSAGQSSFHASNQPHATETHDKGMLAYVLWRNEFQTPPVLTEREVAVLA